MDRSMKGLAATLLMVTLTGCGLFGGDDGTVVVEPVPLPPEAEVVPEAEVAIAPPPQTVLTRPTDPSERMRVIQSGRSDPFAAFLPAVVPETAPSEAPAARPAQPPSTATPTPGSGTPLPAPSQPGVGQPTSPATPPGEIVLPELPQPQLALQVEVSGITELGGSSHAILRAPGEPVTRTVRPGDRLAGNQVYVRAIDFSNRAEPVVILEEAGMRVSAAVGREPQIMSSVVSSIPPIPALYSAHTQP
ncbi:hypothetical protein GS597_18905 [Synechococcales cyanobacterium C]|uniref:Uncharacterized protein n=1 Tax=Petrachloros mirabilis ULC683 TaxID=2781853 RepID=A0A8K2A9X7_9CYAN|nr:hypothetical protein [Petrachloros mirabilis]NCJ08540.1 hypothetical protein [Petrachloros mirabilis ULC683]